MPSVTRKLYSKTKLAL